MDTITILYIILALVASAAIAFFYYKQSTHTKLRYIFTAIRFLVLFAVGILLINPKLKQNHYSIEKPVLAVAVDNSSSVATIADDSAIKSAVNKLLSNKDLNNKFKVVSYKFSDDVSSTTPVDINFSGNITDISKALTTLDKVYGNTVAPIVLFSDGNQTYGNDYSYMAEIMNQPVYSVVVGDTTQYADLKIAHVNVNRYAFYKNDFPVEVFLNYQGNTNQKAEFKITAGNQVYYQENVSFSAKDLSKKININLPANSIGVLQFKAELSTLPGEKNIANNSRQFAVEVLDERTQVAIVSNFPHPDLGALKKSIETNQQRKVTIGKPSDFANSLNDYQLVILYQPNSSFKAIMENLERLEKNLFIITGTKTDWNFLNNNQNIISRRATSTEDIRPVFNSNFNNFLMEDIQFEDFPPIMGYLGAVSFNGEWEPLLQSRVRNITLEEPLMATVENGNRRYAYLFGENSWRWRAKSYLEKGNFTAYDDFIGKLIFYLASNKKKERLQVDAETFYYGNVLINAAYFDKNYQFDPNTVLTVQLKNPTTQKTESFNMQLKGSYFQFNNSSLAPGTYSYTIKAKNTDISKSGTFSVIGYDVEKQFYNADYKKMSKLSQLTKGEVTLLKNTDQLIKNLIDNQAFKPIQKSNKTVSPIISWKLLLFIIVALLATEWFLRKYNGLI